jgi:AMP-binding enzyme C-terminal domain/AMP-binding enzyme
MRLQTETGGVMLTPLPGAWADKPGSVSLPFFGIVPAVLDPATGQELHGPCEGVLAVKRAWPSTLRGVHGDRERFEKTYFQPYAGYYFTGDGVKRDGAPPTHACTLLRHARWRPSSAVLRSAAVCSNTEGLRAAASMHQHRGCKTTERLLTATDLRAAAACHAWLRATAGECLWPQPVSVCERGLSIQAEAAGAAGRRGARSALHSHHAPATRRALRSQHVAHSSRARNPRSAFSVRSSLDAAAACAEHGYYWITGRVDDVINVSGHRIGSAEVESALVGNPKCSEAAVIGIPHAKKGQGIYAFVTLMDDVTFDDSVRAELIRRAAPPSQHCAPSTARPHPTLRPLCSAGHQGVWRC